jgi:hypothetical protein
MSDKIKLETSNQISLTVFPQLVVCRPGATAAANETKRYDFEAKSADEAAEIVHEIKKGIAPYRDV